MRLIDLRGDVRFCESEGLIYFKLIARLDWQLKFLFFSLGFVFELLRQMIAKKNINTYGKN